MTSDERHALDHCWPAGHEVSPREREDEAERDRRDFDTDDEGEDERRDPQPRLESD